MHPRDRLKRIVTKRKYELEFIKKVPVHPRDRLIRKMKKKERWIRVCKKSTATSERLTKKRIEKKN